MRGLQQAVIAVTEFPRRGQKRDWLECTLEQVRVCSQALPRALAPCGPLWEFGHKRGTGGAQSGLWATGGCAPTTYHLGTAPWQERGLMAMSPLSCLLSSVHLSVFVCFSFLSGWWTTTSSLRPFPQPLLHDKSGDRVQLTLERIKDYYLSRCVSDI